MLIGAVKIRHVRGQRNNGALPGGIPADRNRFCHGLLGIRDSQFLSHQGERIQPYHAADISGQILYGATYVDSRYPTRGETLSGAALSAQPHKPMENVTTSKNHSIFTLPTIICHQISIFYCVSRRWPQYRSISLKTCMSSTKYLRNSRLGSRRKR